jgi:hypothetical protein
MGPKVHHGEATSRVLPEGRAAIVSPTASLLPPKNIIKASSIELRVAQIQ